MAKTYDQLQQEISKLQAEAEKARRKELSGVISRIRDAIDHYGITAADLGLAAKPGRKSKGAVARKKVRKTGAKAASGTLYRDETGRSWGGRGKRPQWLRDALLAGRKLEDFKVDSAP